MNPIFPVAARSAAGVRSRHCLFAFLPNLSATLLLVLAATQLCGQTGTATSTTTITSAGSAPSYTLTGTVSGSASAAPSGQVTFVDQTNGGITLGSGTLTAASASWSTAASLTGSLAPQGILATDLNGDGTADLAWVGISPTASVPAAFVALSNGNGTIQLPTIYPLSTTPVAIAAGTLGGSGGASALDLVVVDATSSGSAVMFLNNGQGNFSLGAYVSIPNTNGAVVVGPSSAWVGVATTTGVAILTGSGSNWSVAATLPTLVPPDAFALTNNGLAVGFCASGGTGEVQIYTGSGTSLALTETLPRNGCVKGLATGNLHGTSTDDLIVAMDVASGTNNLATLLDQGSGSYTAEVPFTAPYSGLNGVVTGDFNGDGLIDFAVTSGTANTVSFFYGKGNATFAAPMSVTAGAGADMLATGNLFGPKSVGVAVSNTTANTISLLGVTNSAAATVTGVDIPGTGTHQVYASYGGDSNYAASKSATTGLAGQLIPTQLTVSANPASITAAQQTALTATLTPYNSGSLSTNSESVTFLSGTKTLGTAALSSGTATLNVNTLAAGTDSVSATYAGDANFAPSTASPVPVTVAPGPTVVVTPTSSSLTLSSSGGSTTDTITLASQSGFSGTVNLSCAVNYLGSGTASKPPTCSLNPQSATVSGAGTVSTTLTVAIPGTATASNAPLLGGTGLTLAGALLLGLARRRRRFAAWCCGLLLAVAVLGSIAGCSSNSTSQTTSGSYSVAVTATSGSVTASATIPLTVH